MVEIRYSNMKICQSDIKMKSKEKIFYYILKFLTKFEYQISIWRIFEIQYRISNIKYHSNFSLVNFSGMQEPVQKPD